MDAETDGVGYQGLLHGQELQADSRVDSKEEYDIPAPSKATIYEWVRDYTEEAKDQTVGLKAVVAA